MGRLNKPAIPGYQYRSPERTNARDLTPNLEEDVVGSQRADLERIGRGLNPSAKREYNRRLQQEAGGRAVSRSLSRAGLLSAAGMAGYDAGKEIDKEFPSIGKAIDKAVDKASVRGERAKLTPRASQRLRDMDDEGMKREAMRAVAPDEDYIPYAKGGKVSSASKRADGAAKRGRTRGKIV
jgi:hypothetical protein